MQSLLIDLAHATRAGFEAVGILAIIIGAVWSALQALIDRVRAGRWDVRCFRSRLGRSILLGLEFLVAGDIINTVALEPSLESVGILGAVVVIRTFLSWSLEVEIEGRWPWQSKRSPNENGASG
ncbi:DUF1622 domain-containing protein [Novosphingobium aquimarinum]|uniref:DUF1622 domain-containing protein n=1 Tax=Novosphingobium aquimarinum TaxID=2682494 RepID=UPI0012EBD49C|nr:DUF1622 domain-containing protein [Novosphingobium aquimarinum]